MPTLNRRSYKKPEGQKKNVKLYSSYRWEVFRGRWRAKQPLCQECLRHGRTTKGEEVDHIIPIEHGGGVWDIHNLQTLCKSCHSAKTRKEQNNLIK